MSITRSVAIVVDSRPAEPAPGLHVMRPLPAPGLEHADPFLMLDHFGPLKVEPGGSGGLNPHPHRGFETVTIMLDGAMEHHDSIGNRGVLRPGDVQWMTAASGIVHAEYHERDFAARGGTLHGVQLWVNLPAKYKMDPPGYQDLPAAKIPSVELGAARLRVIAGELAGVRGAARVHTPMLVAHGKIPAGGRGTIVLEPSYDAFIYVISGKLALAAGTSVGLRQMAVLANDDAQLELSAPLDSEFLLLAGEPIGEPVVSYGPFVMSTREEIIAAINDFQSGKMGRLAETTKHER